MCNNSGILCFICHMRYLTSIKLGSSTEASLVSGDCQTAYGGAIAYTCFEARGLSLAPRWNLGTAIFQSSYGNLYEVTLGTFPPNLLSVH